MFYLIAYLSPGDYHRFHSPVDWSITSRKAFPGTLFPVSPFANRMIPSLLALNERVALFGKWEQGFFSFTAVGAYNVGSIRLNHEISLKTNDLVKNFSCPNLRLLSYEGVGTYAYEKIYDSPVQCERAKEIGHFNFGSTVVIVFEANRTFQFSVNVGDTIKLGEPLGL
jgi:phosphatidylserine decarboxylase